MTSATMKQATSRQQQNAADSSGKKQQDFISSQRSTSMREIGTVTSISQLEQEQEFTRNLQKKNKINPTHKPAAILLHSSIQNQSQNINSYHHNNNFNLNNMAPATTTTTTKNRTRLSQQLNRSVCRLRSRFLIRGSQRRRAADSSRSLLLASGCCYLVAAAFVVLLILQLEASSLADAASARGTLNKQTNQFFLNEFCDLQSKTIRSAKKFKHSNTDTHSVILSAKNTDSSVRVLPQKQQIPSSISFGFGQSQASNPQAPIFKQLNCSIIVVAPKSHGLMVKVNSMGLPKNLTRLGITLNHDSPHAQHVQLEGEEEASANYLLTQPQSSKIAINLQSLQPIDWSRVSFDILFTVYKKANGTQGCPNKKWFDCGDNICVPYSLVCDNNRNCPNGNDEMIFYKCYTPLFWSIAGSALLGLALIGALVGAVILVVSRRRSLSKEQSSSNNKLARSEADLSHDPAGSKLDLSADGKGNLSAATSGGSYLASNLYLGGFENPVWSNGTLTKQTSGKQQASTSTQN